MTSKEAEAAQIINANLSSDEAQAPSTKSPLALGRAENLAAPCHCLYAEGHRCDACKDAESEPRIPASAYEAICRHDRPEPDPQDDFVPATYYNLSPRNCPSHEALDFVVASMHDPIPYYHHAACCDRNEHATFVAASAFEPAPYNHSAHSACCDRNEHATFVAASAFEPAPYHSAHSACCDLLTFVEPSSSPRGVSSAP
ncbi:hypothetical protein SPRG_08598 [Saprolegnia parasitica CBS 223.65]|uniref:Uncharacterized protein n=1 Tax=Saprolegnia parasitica (strain CBS 223.65) TaxID=695850 RepID=A0A067C5Z0_SAPPC|nr:hypothetical protein SPRG_08598 [Saprolegnia parasitica CBS 223.65]KDO25943.1 hypothetical protein SPRG_08598 [Saprolegnia parasitica CBS 223.65]|eukprot:XP_012203232.1 hypothetical protein SPRG_08598 [Saprolegnia parasitica CBS 223.65]